VHRPDADDAFYANVAVAAVEHPELPLLARDTLHGRFDLPVHLPSYRLHSYEVAVAALSLLTGIAALPLFHLVAGPLAALFVPLAHASLFRLLAPRVWLFATAVLVLVLAAPGETHRWYGNFAFVRMWQGKAILLSIAAPWIAALALRFALAPSRIGWLRLAAAQIAAIGASASALWLAPALSLAAMASVLRPGVRDLRVLGLGALASAYPIAAALAQKSAMLERAPHLAERFAPGEQLASALTTALGEATLLRVGIAALFVAWACWGRGLARRYAIALPLAVTLVLLAPWADALVRANVTGPSYWRALWALPVPILIALVIAAPLQWERAGAPRPQALAAAAALALLFAVVVPQSYGFSAENHARLGWPGLRVPAHAFAWAERINALAPGERVVAPRSISIWIPTLPHPAFPLAVRSYLSPLRELIGETAYRDRNVMTQLAGGSRTHPEAEAIFARGLELYDVAAVCLRNGSGPAPALRAILHAEGYRRRAMGTQVELWVREGEALEDAPRAPHGAAQP
jgi:MFS family permease